MTKTETRLLTREQLKARISGRTKVPEIRRDKGVFLIGYIQCLRDLEKLCRAGNEKAQMFADLCRLREDGVVKQLRRL